jgi:hypothetical protein
MASSGSSAWTGHVISRLSALSLMAWLGPDAEWYVDGDGGMWIWANRENGFLDLPFAVGSGLIGDDNGRRTSIET